MLTSPIRCCCIIMSRNHGVLPLNKNNMVHAVTGFGHRNYAKGDKDCCKEVAQTEGKRVEPWPKDDPPPPAWRCECPREPQPPNYDPYRIKVPDIVVPPLPPSNAKGPHYDDPWENYGNPDCQHAAASAKPVTDLFYNSPIMHPDYWKQKQDKNFQHNVNEALPKLGYHGKTKYKYAFHEPWKPLDRLALLEQAEREEMGQPALAENTDNQIAS